MTKIERLQKALNDHTGFKANLEQQIERDKLQIAQNEDTIKQVEVTMEAVQAQIDALTAGDSNEPAQILPQG